MIAVTAARGWKRLGFGVLAVVAVSVGALTLLPYLIPADHIRDTVRAEIRAVTGLEPVLRGPTRVSLFPSATITFADVILGDDATGEPALAAARLTAQLQLLPLLLGRTDISDVSLLQPHIFVNFDKDGQSNWSRLIGALSRSLTPEAERDAALSFSQIRISDGTIRLRDAANRIDETVSNVGLSLAWPSLTRSFAATGQAVWRRELVDVSLSIADLLAALTGERSGVKLRLTAKPAKFAFDGHLSYRPNLRIQGTLAADAPSLRDAMRWAGQRPLPGGGFERFALKAQTNILGNAVSLPTVNVEMDGNTAEGVLSFVMSGRPTLQGTLAAEDIDLSHYVSTARLMRQGDRDWNRLPIGLEGLNAFDFDLRLSAAHITVMGAKLGRTAIAANLRDGQMAITIGESQAFGGLLKGAVGLGKGPNGADVKAQLNFTDIDLENCLGELFAIRRLEGKGNLVVNVEGSGASVLEVTRTLSGRASLTARQGALAGLNVEQALRRFERQPLSGSGDLRNGRTPFERLSVILKLAQGIATVDELRFEGSGIRLAVAGTASIPARDLDLKGLASLVPTTAAGRVFELPFVVQGGWDDPVMLPDADSLIRHSRATGPLLDALKGRTARDLVRSAIDQLTRGAGTAPPQPSAVAVPAIQVPAK